MGLKATFDIYTRIITLIEPPVLENGDWVVDLDVAVDLYSDGKEDWKATELFRRVAFPISVVGGQATPTGKLDATFFLRPDWKIQPYDANHRLRVDGNFFSSDGRTPFLTVPSRTVVIEQNLSAIVGVTFADEEAIALVADLAGNPAVYFDPVDGVPGTGDDVGVNDNPVNNEADAFTLLASRKKSVLKIVKGTFTFDRNVSDLFFDGPADYTAATVDLNGWASSRCGFRHVTLTGDADNSRVAPEECLLDNLINAAGIFTTCYLRSVTLSVSGTASFISCTSNVLGSGTPYVDFQGHVNGVEFRNYSGGLELRNITSPTCSVSVDMNSGHLRLDASCTDLNSLVLRGVGKFTNLSSIDTTKMDSIGFVNPRLTADAVWDANAASYTTPGSVGELLTQINQLAEQAKKLLLHLRCWVCDSVDF